LKITTEQPKEGHFTAVWEYGGLPWSDTYKWISGKLSVYCGEDGFIASDSTEGLTNVHYVIL